MAANYKPNGSRANLLQAVAGHQLTPQAHSSRARVGQPIAGRVPRSQPNSTRAKLLTGLPGRRIKSVYQIIIRSFISADKVGFGPSVFLGDNRGPSAEITKNIGFRAMHKFDVFVSSGHNYLRTYRQRSSATIGILPNLPAGSPPIIIVDHAQTQITPSFTEQTRNSLGNIITSFETSYWAQDPVTPQLFTPALDVHATFALTANEEQGSLTITAIIRGDLFPSTEVILVNPEGTHHVLLGAHMEKGGLPDLFGDNNKLLINIDLQVKVDAYGNFTKIRSGYRDYSVDQWNFEVRKAVYQKP